MSTPLVKYWVNKHSMVDEHSAMRTSSDIPVYLAADVDALLRQREEGIAAMMADKQYHMDCINLLAKHIGRLGDTSNTVINAAIQQLAASQARCAELTHAMEAAASMAGKNWLEAQLILCKALTLTERPPAIDIQRFERAPCYWCGYGGGGYYQPDTHPCAKDYHNAVEERPPA